MENNKEEIKPKYLVVIHNDKIYWYDGKVGTTIKTGRLSAEYRNISSEGESRVWADLETGEISCEDCQKEND
jgi:hypothetical protein